VENADFDARTTRLL